MIAGPRTEAQWQEYLGALDYAFTPEDEALVDGFVAAGHPTTPGYNDPAYPLEGRVPRGGGKDTESQPTPPAGGPALRIPPACAYSTMELATDDIL